MSGLVYVDNMPTFEVKGDNVFMTVPSGTEQMQLVMSRNIFCAMAQGAFRFVNAELFADAGAQIVPGPKPARTASKRGK